MAFALLVDSGALAEENCGTWHTADADPTGGQYLVDLRICDLTYGLSAYIQIRNSSDKRLALTYRLITKDDKSKDNDIVLDPGNITRAGNCQACAKRYAGFKSWEILSAKPTAKQPEAKIESPVPASAVESTPPAAASTSAAAVTPAPSAVPARVNEKPAAKEMPLTPAPTKVMDQSKPVEAAPVVTTSAPVEKSVVSQAPAQTSNSDVSKNTDKKVDGFKAEDGTIIPWDQLPPEFRPRTKNESNKN